MSFGLEVGIFAAYAAGLFAVYILGRFLIIPLKWAGRLILSSIVGGIVIMAVNLIGGSRGIFVPLNPLTAAVTGLLGVPGAVCLLAFFNL